MSRYLVTRPFRTHRRLELGELIGKGVRFPAGSLRSLLTQGYMKEITDQEAAGLIRTKAEARAQTRVGKEPVKTSAVGPQSAREGEQDKVGTSESVRPSANRTGI
jgi:hypothetical protein